MPNEQVLEGMYTLDLAHITHVRHREHRRFIAPGERVLARLLRAGAYDSVTHLMVEWPTEAELEAVAKLPKFEGLRLPKLFGLELDVTGATTLSHVLDLIGPEMESRVDRKSCLGLIENATGHCANARLMSAMLALQRGGERRQSGGDR
jgi:hypothetical protein